MVSWIKTLCFESFQIAGKVRDARWQGAVEGFVLSSAATQRYSGNFDSGPGLLLFKTAVMIAKGSKR